MASNNNNNTAAEVPFDIPKPIECLITPDRETTLWNAHCLDFDLISSGKTPEAAWVNIKAVVRLHIEHSFTHDRAGLRRHEASPELRAIFKKLKEQKTVRSDKIELNLLPPKEPEHAADLWIQGVEELGCATPSLVQSVH